MFRCLEVETYSRCNLACPLCPVSRHRRPEERLDAEVFFRIVDELAEIGYRGTFSPHFYNEPFADDRLEDFVGYVARRLPRATIRIFTNTTLLTAQRFRSMAELGVDEYVVTIDEERIRRSYERLISELSPGEREQIRPRRIFGSALHNRGGLIEGLPNVHRPSRCRLPEDYCVVNAHGDVVLCYNDYFARHAFGNVREAKLLDIWRAPEFAAARGRIASGDLDYDICRACEVDPATAGVPERPRGALAALLRRRRRNGGR